MYLPISEKEAWLDCDWRVNQAFFLCRGKMDKHGRCVLNRGSGKKNNHFHPLLGSFSLGKR